MKVFILAVLVGLLAGCTNSYWARPGATLPDLVSESENCYRAAFDFDAPSALPGPSGAPQLLPRTTPPPRLWERAPSAAAFERFDEQLKYERCMHTRGWDSARASAPKL